MKIANLRRSLAAGLVAITLGTACAGGDDGDTSATSVAPPRSLPVVVDYSPTVSDAGALLYLAAHPDVDLRAVTLVGTGESRCDAAIPNTLGLLALVGHAGVPVACGSSEPIGPGHEWPTEWRDAADELFPLGLHATATAGSGRSAVDLLTATAADTDGLVIVALGPLTNLAAAARDHPEFADNVAMTYSMGGALGATGNAPNGAEWNYYVDPAAVDEVVRSELPLTIVPLDATNHVPVNEGLYRRMRGRDQNPAMYAVRQLWTAGTPWRNGSFLWDELTAMLAVDPALAPSGATRIEVVTQGADAGRTIPAADGHEVLVAGRPDRRRAESEFLAVLNGADRT